MLNIDQAIAVICKEFEGFTFVSYDKDEHDADRCVVRGTYGDRKIALDFPILRLRTVDAALLKNIRKQLIGNE
ncbi:hypothetical protein RGU70_12235 [Herbaspirillum sp. RTI4]|uniref:hypothetical protein n=1 Tax=Herbaspirillum sp. RTI4 TaxID=3048640 RepID=UPI002AB5B403|nr:hypothetical protein [Herbaspirillum sp. RTI4]MDY7579092.1 hypothetical protein [Herbaspirillum sp. RTI4]MEA9981329.1 hypothetical protein [Herbaspirillum sp. RTI4]